MCKIIIILSLFVYNFIILAQDLDYKNRMYKQVDFIIEYSKKNNWMGENFNSLKEVDERIEILKNAWITHINSDDSVLNRFDGYTLLMIANISGLDEKIQKYIFTNFTAKNLFEDIALISSKEPLPALYLLNKPTYDNMIWFTLNTNLAPEVWNNLYKSFMKLLPIIDTALANYTFDEEFKKELLYIYKMLIGTNKEFELLNAIYNDKLDLGFTLLFTNFSQGLITKDKLIKPGKMLVDKFCVNHRKDQAFATLDLLSQYTIEGELSRSLLKEWYQNIDVNIGLQKFNLANQSSRNSILVKTDKQYKLTGLYHNLTDNSEFDMSTLDNKYVFIDFWATWCGPCKLEIPNLEVFHHRNKSTKDFIFITVVTDAVTNGADEIKIMKFIKENDISYIVLYDTKENSLARYFNVNAYPTKFLLDKDGYVLQRNKNEDSINLEVVEDYLKSITE